VGPTTVSPQLCVKYKVHIPIQGLNMLRRANHQMVIHFSDNMRVAQVNQF